MQPTRLPRKKDVALQLLEQATVFVHLDPRAEAVRVPPWFKKQPQLVLQIGLNMAVPIPDLDVDDNGLSCTLSFNRSPFMCVIPWSAVFALVDENRQGMVWPDDVPPELAAQAAQAKPAPARPELKVAPNPRDDEAPVKTAAKTAPSAKAKRARKAATKTRTRPEVVEKRVAAPVVKRAAAGTKARPATPAAKPRAVAKRAPAAAAQKPAPQKAPAQKAPAAQKAAPRAEPAVAPAPAAAAGGGSKRKLPPYLRIVK